MCKRVDVARFVVDCQTLLGIAAGEIEVSEEHQLVAPTLVRSQALATLYEAARRGEISPTEVALTKLQADFLVTANKNLARGFRPRRDCDGGRASHVLTGT